MKTNTTTPRTFRGFTAIAIALAALGLCQPEAQAATITWGSAQDDTDLASDVRVNGTFVDAVTTYGNKSGSDVTLNGVTFKHYSSSSGSTLTFGTSGISMTYPTTNLNFNTSPVATAYRQLRRDSMYAQNGSGTITLSNLTSGYNYQVQVWAPDWNGNIDARFDNQVTILGRNYSAGNHSQYAVGTFTADGTTQVINFVAGPGGYCYAPTAISLRDVSVADPAISATGSPLAALSTTYGTASSAASFTVSGANMAAGIAVTPPVGLEVSTDSATTGFAGSGTALTVGSAGTITSTTVWARLAATAAIGTYNSQNIVLSSSGAPSVNVTTAATGNNVIGGSTKLVITSTAVSTVAGVASGSITLQRQNESGTPITDEASITVALSSDSSGTKTFTPASLTINNGSSSATFTYTDTKAGTPTLTAALSPLTSATQVETVTPDTASQLAFGVQPTTTTAGSAISPSVTVLVKDQYGNTVTTDSGRTVTIGSSTTAFTIGSTLTADTVDGVATFSAIQPTTAGNNKTLTASDGSLTNATSNAFTVNGAAATQLVFTSAPVSTPAGVASGAITVQRRDQYNNPTTTEASRTVTLTSDSSGTVTFTPASPRTIATGSSSATFTYTDTSVGTPTLTAASTSPTSITSAEQTETVTAAPAIITWGSATDVTWSDSDVLANGTPVAAVTTWRNADLTVNGVAFSKYLSIASGVMTFNTANISMAWSLGVPSNDNGAPVEQYVSPPQTTDYYKMLYYSCYGGNSSSGSHRGTITLSGLTVGQTYQVQVWVPQWNNNDHYQIGGITVNVGNWNGSPASQLRAPQYIVGSFTATSTSQPISWNAVSGGGSSYVPAAVALRDVTGGSVSNYTTWLGEYTFAEGADTTPTGDPDGDGLNNQQEYAFGLDPTSGSSVNPISQQLDKTSGTFKYTRRKTSGLTYIYQWSTTLSDAWNDFTPVTNPPAAADISTTVEEVTIEVPTAQLENSKLFLRVKAE